MLTIRKKHITINPRLLKVLSYLTKKILLPMQRQVAMVQLVAMFAICITLLVLTQRSVQTSYTDINMKIVLQDQKSPIMYTYTSTLRIKQSEKKLAQVTMFQNEMEVVKRELNHRKQQMMHECEIIGSEKSHLDAALTNMIIDTEHNVAWCPIYKVASSTWMNHFAMLKGILTDVIINLMRHNHMQISDIVKQKLKHDMDLNKTYETVAKTKKFLIVRHPLERLLSAYRDKLEHMQDREYYYKRFGRRITFKYRQLSDETKLEPTFEEFLRFIVKEKYFDEHWAPYYKSCAPCIINYDYILKFETLNRDQNFFIQDVNLSTYLHNTNYSRNINPHGKTTREILDKYIKDIPRSLLDEIYKIYENDYKLFDYSFI